MEEMAFKSIHYQRISSEEEIVDEDLPPTVVSTKANEERGMFFVTSFQKSALDMLVVTPVVIWSKYLPCKAE